MKNATVIKFLITILIKWNDNLLIINKLIINKLIKIKFNKIIYIYIIWLINLVSLISFYCKFYRQLMTSADLH